MASGVIILSGTSSSGKTSIAQALQETTAELFLHVSIDHFYAMLPDWFRWNCSEQWLTVNLNLQRALFSTAAVLVKEDNYVVVDTFIFDRQSLQISEHLLDGYRVLFVGLRCPLAEVERRERERGDRTVGLARSQFPFIHTHSAYDLETDTSHHTPHECAAIIRKRL